jgi:hypothetical protein
MRRALISLTLLTAVVTAGCGGGTKPVAAPTHESATPGARALPADADMSGVKACGFVSPGYVSQKIGELQMPPLEKGPHCAYIGQRAGQAIAMEIRVEKRSEYTSSFELANKGPTGGAELAKLSGLGDEAYSVTQTCEGCFHHYDVSAAKGGKAVFVSITINVIPTTEAERQTLETDKQTVQSVARQVLDQL